MTFVFNPLRELVRNTTDFEQEVERLFGSNGHTDSVYAPAVEILETKDAFQVEIDLPGLSKDDVKISIDKNVLTIQGERKAKSIDDKNSYHHNERVFGSFRRSFNLSRLVKSDAVEARYENGVLTMVLPKMEEAKPREINVKIS